MKVKSIITVLAFILFVAAPAICAENAEQSAPGDIVNPAKIPSAVIPRSKYEFEPVLEGINVVHEFIIENIGTAPLEIERIKTGCGCTTADFTRTIPPGEHGSITIKVNTRGYGGRMFMRHMTVYTNDPQNLTMSLEITGKVDQFAKIAPTSAVLKGKADESIQAHVSIMPDKKYPFHVIDSFMDEALDGKIEYTLEKLENGYVMLITNRFHETGRYHGTIFLRTDCPARPEISIPVIGIIG
ncbi:MAG: OS_HP2 family (seleno)protein [Dissulfuribacterales bacterium]